MLHHRLKTGDLTSSSDHQNSMQHYLEHCRSIQGSPQRIFIGLPENFYSFFLSQPPNDSYKKPISFIFYSSQALIVSSELLGFYV